MSEGYYVVITFKSAPDFPAELDRLFNIDETIMRSTILKLDHKALEKAAKAKAAAEAAAAAAEEAAPAAEEVTTE
jgi:ribosomal protein S6